MCGIAFAPGTSAPSIAVVRKILLPQTIGDECPRPAIGVFHLIFFVALHSVGRFFSSEVPCPDGPRHCGQLALPAAAAELTTNKVEKIATTNAIPMRPLSFIFVSSKRQKRECSSPGQRRGFGEFQRLSVSSSVTSVSL